MVDNAHTLDLQVQGHGTFPLAEKAELVEGRGPRKGGLKVVRSGWEPETIRSRSAPRSESIMVA